MQTYTFQLAPAACHAPGIDYGYLIDNIDSLVGELANTGASYVEFSDNMLRVDAPSWWHPHESIAQAGIFLVPTIID